MSFYLSFFFVKISLIATLLSDNAMAQIKYSKIILPSYMGPSLHIPCTLDVDRSKLLVLNVNVADHFSKDYGALLVKPLFKIESP